MRSRDPLGVRPRCYHHNVLDARLRSDRLALAAALGLALCGALAAIAFPPLTPVLLAPAVVLAAAARPAGLLLAPLAAALPLPFAAADRAARRRRRGRRSPRRSPRATGAGSSGAR